MTLACLVASLLRRADEALLLDDKAGSSVSCGRGPCAISQRVMLSSGRCTRRPSLNSPRADEETTADGETDADNLELGIVCVYEVVSCRRGRGGDRGRCRGHGVSDGFRY